MIQRALYQELVHLAISEDLGDVGDVTTNSIVPDDVVTSAELRAREAGAIAGLEVAGYVFQSIDGTLVYDNRVQDGDRVPAGTVLAIVSGPARSILSSERTALNFLCRMSGVATQTALLVDAVEGTGVQISDSRRTLPGHRALDKYAVRMGGGVNNRSGLHESVVVKASHAGLAGSITAAVEAVRSHVGHTMAVEVEVGSLRQLEEVLETDTDTVLLESLSPLDLAEAVRIVDGQMTIEATGAINAETVREVAECGVDIISVGWITNSAPSLDIGVDYL